MPAGEDAAGLESFNTMNRTEFAAYRNTFVTATRAILEESGARAGGDEVDGALLDEAAFPAYAEANPLAARLFWERVRRVMRHLEKRPIAASPWAVLDFGCGGGVMLPFLARRAARVVAADMHLEPLRQMAARLPLPHNVETHDLSRASLDELEAASFHCILALDVLEHMDDLPATLKSLRRLLAPGGEMIVSGPTENALYRLGRKLAGARYSGDYHARDIYAIRRAMSGHWRVGVVATLFRPIPLFVIYRARPRDAAAVPHSP